MAALTIGLVGCGYISADHARGYLALRDLVRVTAVCDVDPERAHARAAQLGVERVFTRYEDLLADGGVDAVDLCLPHQAHAPATIAAAHAGKHVLVEKPIATTLADADAMIAAARAAGVTLMVAHNQRYHPQHQRIKALLDEGAIGPIYCARADHNQDFRPPAGHWIYRREPTGGGAMIGYGVHRIDVLRWYVGEVAAVGHFQVTRPERFEGEASTVTNLRFASGAIGEITINWVVRRSPWMDMLYLYGERGSLHNVGGLFVDSDADPYAADGFSAVAVPPGDAFAEQIRHFAHCLRDGRTPLTDGVDARRTLEVCLAAYRSVETGQIITLPLATN